MTVGMGVMGYAEQLPYCYRYGISAGDKRTSLQVSRIRPIQNYFWDHQIHQNKISM